MPKGARQHHEPLGGGRNASDLRWGDSFAAEEAG